ncbi:MAG: GNAT family N-acetyltransferase [Anaerolineae bacterium]|nr:GNAT family N-acetyltransferase [Anaerolineae bacterium]
MQQIIYRTSPSISNKDLNVLFQASWPDHRWRDFEPILGRSLATLCAYQGERLVGFVNLAWDGGLHAFLLDTTVHPDLRRRGIGTELVRRAADVARQRGIEWLHVDFEPHLTTFYRRCGFQHTEAGLIDLKETS